MIKSTIMNKGSLELMKQRAEELLEKKGLEIDHPELCDILIKKGCFIKDGRVCIPHTLVSSAIEKVPAEFTLHSPDGENNLVFPHPDGGFYTRTNTGAPNYRTPEGDVHSFTLEDAAE